MGGGGRSMVAVEEKALIVYRILLKSKGTERNLKVYCKNLFLKE
jgi:hypothetical protein